MAIHVRDSRQDEADRHYDRLVQQGVPPTVAARMLPALVSSNEGLRAVAHEWLNDYAVGTGHDLSPEGVARDRALANAASEFIQNQMELGSFAGEPMFRTGNRYDAPEDAVHEELDRITPHRGYPEAAGNRFRLALSEAEKDLPAGYRVDDDGTVRDRAGQPTGQRVELPEARNVVVTDGMVQNTPTQRSASFVHYSSAETGEWEDGPNRPFFA